MIGHLPWQALDGNPPGKIVRAMIAGGWFVLSAFHRGIDVLHPTVESPGEEHGFS